MVTETLPIDEKLERELAAGLDLLDQLSVTDRMHLRGAVNALSRSIDEIRAEQKSIMESDPESHVGPLLRCRIGQLEDLRLRLLFAALFGQVFWLDGEDETNSSGRDRLAENNIVVDGVALAHEPLF